MRKSVYVRYIDVTSIYMSGQTRYRRIMGNSYLYMGGNHNQTSFFFCFLALLKSCIFTYSNSISSESFWATTKTRAVLECQKLPLEQQLPEFSFSISFFCYSRKSGQKWRFFDFFFISISFLRFSQQCDRKWKKWLVLF